MYTKVANVFINIVKFIQAFVLSTCGPFENSCGYDKVVRGVTQFVGNEVRIYHPKFACSFVNITHQHQVYIGPDRVYERHNNVLRESVVIVHPLSSWYFADTFGGIANESLYTGGMVAWNDKHIFITKMNIVQPILSKNATIILKIGVLSICCGNVHVLILTKTNQVWGHGTNSHGQLGLPLQMKKIKDLIPVHANNKFNWIKAGAFTSYGSAVCTNNVIAFGSNKEHLLGVQYIKALNNTIKNINIFAAGLNNIAYWRKSNETISIFGGNKGGQHFIQDTQIGDQTIWESHLKSTTFPVMDVQCGNNHILLEIKQNGVSQWLTQGSGSYLYTHTKDYKNQFGLFLVNTLAYPTPALIKVIAVANCNYIVSISLANMY